LMIVVEPGRRSIETAHAIVKLASDLGIKCIRVLMNKVVDEADKKLLKQNFPDEQILGFAPFDRTLMKLDREGKAPYDFFKNTNAPFFDEMKTIKDKVINLIESSAAAS
ncbi:MAG: carbon monoxide dehydrogenase, partial [Candidatus Abyssubacteria bacterium]|nr:carbon monoxide dehydrogenase [Candidatus Abyssubacteria bacterium]